MKLFWHKIKNFFTKLPYRFSKTKVRAVYDSDLADLVESLGVKDEIENGSHVCKFCSTSITFENLRAIQKEAGELQFICTNLTCFSKI